MRKSGTHFFANPLNLPVVFHFERSADPVHSGSTSGGSEPARPPLRVSLAHCSPSADSKALYLNTPQAHAAGKMKWERAPAPKVWPAPERPVGKVRSYQTTRIFTARSLHVRHGARDQGAPSLVPRRACNHGRAGNLPARQGPPAARRFRWPRGQGSYRQSP